MMGSARAGLPSRTRRLVPAGQFTGPPRQQIAACDRKLALYRAALDAGASPATVGGWSAETEAERARLTRSLRQDTPRLRLGEAKIEAMTGKLDDMAAVIRAADPGDKSEVYQQMGLS
jgi:site-specific DNA recombinase